MRFSDALREHLVVVTMEKSLEQRYAIQFCVKLKKTPLETYGMLAEAYGDACLSRSQSNRWHKKFTEGREEVADEHREGRPSSSRCDENAARVRKLLNTDRRMSLQMLADALDIPKTSVYRIVREDFQMRKVCAKLGCITTTRLHTPRSLSPATWPGSVSQRCPSLLTVPTWPPVTFFYSPE